MRLHSLIFPQGTSEQQAKKIADNLTSNLNVSQFRSGWVGKDSLRF